MNKNNSLDNLVKLNYALKIISKNIKSLNKTEYVSINESLGRIISENIVSQINVPPHSNSAVDGYAIRFKDLNSKTHNNALRVKGKSKAGSFPRFKLGKMCAARVLTGAILPQGADTVIMEENCEVKENRITIRGNIKKGINYRNLGEDIKNYSQVFSKGHKVRAQDIGILSSLGLKKIRVNKQIRVGVFSSGDEVSDPGKKLTKGKLYDSNRPMIIALLQILGCKVVDLGILEDNQTIIKNKFFSIQKKLNLIISTGAMSLGDEDHIKRILDKYGKLHVWRLAIKPGRPVGFGFLKKTPILALPGNPTAAFVTFLSIGIPLINKMIGNLNTYKIFKVPISFKYTKKAGRKEFLRVKAVKIKGNMMLKKFPIEGAGILTSTSWADGFAIIDENTTELGYDDLVNYLSFNEILK